jgi:hypothetical protein
VTKSSNHTQSLHRLTSNSLSPTKFQWIFSTDNWFLTFLSLLYSVVQLLKSQFQFCSLCCTPLYSALSPFSWFFGTQLLQALFRVSYKSSARTTQEKLSLLLQRVYCTLRNNEHSTDHREHRSYIVGRLFVGTCLLKRCLAMGIRSTIYNHYHLDFCLFPCIYITYFDEQLMMLQDTRV